MAAKMRVQHLSMYSLTVEEGTILSKHIAQGKTANIVEDFQAELYIKSCEKAEEVGFAQYEVSNFCVPGYESVHNSAYWNGASYIGLGPSAHSFDGKSRRWNKSDLIAYIKGAEKGKIPFDSEKLSSIDKYNEYLLTRLRLLEGISLRDMEKQFGAEALAQFRGDIAKNKYQEFFVMENNSLSLSRSGLLLADGIIASLMKG
jgi:oxygen-independent coproporphyrinogen-3 oxidase